MNDDTELRAQMAREVADLGVSPQAPDDVESARVKTRGDYYADCAFAAVINGMAADRDGRGDAVRASNLIRQAQVYATLSLRDSIQEITATLKEVANRQIDSTQGLDETIKKATNVTVVELRRATMKEVA